MHCPCIQVDTAGGDLERPTGAALIVGTPLYKYRGGGSRLTNAFDLDTWEPSSRTKVPQQLPDEIAQGNTTHSQQQHEMSNSKDSGSSSYDTTIPPFNSALSVENLGRHGRHEQGEMLRRGDDDRAEEREPQRRLREEHEPPRIRMAVC